MEYRFDIEQNTDEWYQIKVGKFSASIAADLLMAKKTKGYTNLINRIVEERITGEATESKTFTGNKFTERGHEFEPIAREDYEFSKLEAIKQVGVVELNDWVLCSPDGLINENGLIQIKCPIFNTQKEYHLKYNELKSNPHNDILKKISSVYYKQMQFELFVTGREYNVFYSYHPNLKPIELIIVRDEELITDIKTRLNEAIKEVETQIEFINNL